MTYVEDEVRNFLPLEEDEFFICEDGFKKRKIFGEPIVLNQTENELWEEFEQWFESKYD